MVNIVQWQDLFVVIDDGKVTISEYGRIEPLVKKQSKAFTAGLGCLVIIPETGAPPPSSVRRHLQAMLGRLPMRALCYVVEGTGFRAAAVRAALISLGIFQSNNYPTKVVTSLQEALEWMVTAPSDRSAAMRAINEVRVQPPPTAPLDVSSSRRMVK